MKMSEELVSKEELVALEKKIAKLTESSEACSVAGDSRCLNNNINELTETITEINRIDNTLRKKNAECLANIVLGLPVGKECFDEYMKMVKVTGLRKDANDLRDKSMRDWIKLMQ